MTTDYEALKASHSIALANLRRTTAELEAIKNRDDPKVAREREALRRNGAVPPALPQRA